MSLKKTILNPIHKNLKAKMVEFAGWEMPVQYSSILEEHLSVRNYVGIFDVSHMGQIKISGTDSIDFLEKITPNLVFDQNIKQIRYNAILNEKGGVKDDITIMRESENDFLIIVNASNTEKIWNFLFLEAENYKDVRLENLSDQLSMLAIQGPKAEEILIQVFSNYKNIIQSLKYYHFETIKYQNEEILISRTGYTGEDGFEIILLNELCPPLWVEFINLNTKPCGLGARDSLRLEVLYPLYGHELNEDRTPVESGIGWIVKEKKVPYNGKELLLEQKKNHPKKIILPFLLEENGIPREGYKVYGKEILETYSSPPCFLPDMISDLDFIGIVQSGVYSPILKTGIGTAFLPYSFKENYSEIFIEIRNKKLRGKIHFEPFVKGTAKKNK
ncbi:MAG: glycine cleavage system aminomethyltransferase GcvT [Leptonema sp. (in: bacteria)]